ncbi:MAG TPA: hypothetical protein PLN48_13120 [Lachnospiraceae bacterium]|nr:hypothetical protein [Lachnospiraceae bacterium]
MEIEELFDFLVDKFKRVLKDSEIEEESVSFAPLKEGVLRAVFKGTAGLACTCVRETGTKTLKEICEGRPGETEEGRACFIASVNAVMIHIGCAVRNSLCEDGEPLFCGENIASYISDNYGSPKVLLVGPKEGIEAGLAKKGLSVMSVSDRKKPEEADIDGADLLLISGSTVITGTITDYLSLDKEIVFFGMTLAGTAEWLGVKRLCF